MYVFASFDHSSQLELALASLEEAGVSKENILAVPIERRKPARRLLDTIHSSDGISLIDLAVVMGTALAVIGASYGFILRWGPIIWGLIGAAVGIVTGVLIKYFKYKDVFNHPQRIKNKWTEVIVLVHCQSDHLDKVVQILWDHYAFGVGKYTAAKGR
jgi:hypothetical protein